MDGAPDELEFIAGTDAANPNDFLKFDRVSCDGTNCVLEFTGRAGRSYTVEKRTQFGSGDTWTTVRANLSESGSTMALDPLAPEPVFYRPKTSRN